jgi:hypothetical protein
MNLRSICERVPRYLGLGCLGLAALLAALTPGISQAQVLYGSITGNVKDASGAAIPGATVAITNRATNFSREVVTDEAGSYDIPTVPTGVYTVKVTARGFKTTTKENVEVTLNNISRVDLTAQIGEVAETVVITAETPQLQTDRAEVRAELNERTLENLPVPLGRNYQNLFKTLPGITPPENAHSIPSNPSRSLVFNVNGTSRSSNNTRIDGVSTTNIWLPHVTGYVPALESIEVVNVVTNSFDAEQGLAGGAAINVQIKSGTNEFHGSAFEYHHNHHLRARNFFLPTTEDKGKFIYNQYGGTFGGPIKRDKLFFFASYEGTNDRENVGRIGSVPTAAMRTGDLSASTTPIYDPATGALNGTGRTQFTGNRIPADRIDPITKKIIALIPLPNLPSANPEQNNYFASAPFRFDRWTIDSKVNWVVSSKFNMFGRYSILNFDTFQGTFFGRELGGVTISTGTANPGHGFGKTHNYSVGGVYTFTPNFIVDANFGFVRMGQNVEQERIEEKIGLDFLGIPGTNGKFRFEGGWPRFDVSGFNTYGVVETYMPYFRNDDQYQIVGNANWLKGAHSIRFGMDFYHQAMNHTQPEWSGGGTSHGARGGFSFASGPTQRCEAVNSSGSCTRNSQSSNYNSWATFLLGLPTSAGKLNQTVEVYTTRNNQYSFYIRDQWQVNNKLTLSYGTRWEYFPVSTRADRGLERYNVTTNKLEIGGVGSIPTDLGVEVSKTMFAPRFGVAYRPASTFVVRLGYGITNDPYALARPLRTNPPILINFNLQQPNSLQPASRLRDGLPIVPVPDFSSGVIDLAGNIAVTTLPDEFKRGYVQSWNLTLQKELKWGWVGEVGYVGTRQIRQLGFEQLNWSPIGGGRNGRQLFARFGRDASTTLVGPIGSSKYNALQARLDHRFRNGYQLGMSYTWSKSIGIAGADNSDGSPQIKIPQFYHLNRALSGFDRTHNLQITNILELPFGKGKRWLSNGGLFSALLSGWQVNNILSFYSGSPFNVTASGTSLNAPESSQRADLVKPKVEILGGAGRGQKYFDTLAFANVTEARFGTAAWNILRGPGVANWDFGLFRKFQLTERWDLQFRAEAFNFTNTPHFSNPNGSVTSSSFGEISSTNPNLPERQFRFGLRLGF